MVKLRIELSMASLIRRIASEKNEFVGTYSGSHSNPLSRVTNKNSTQLTELRSGRNHATATHVSDDDEDDLKLEGEVGIRVRKQVIVETVSSREDQMNRPGTPSGGSHTRRSSSGTDQRPLANNGAAKGEGW